MPKQIVTGRTSLITVIFRLGVFSESQLLEEYAQVEGSSADLEMAKGYLSQLLQVGILRRKANGALYVRKPVSLTPD
jgi:hypothetical protein